MSDLIRTDTLFGSSVNIVGNISADLVLESLGKIYIKSRNSAHTLEEVIKSIALNDANDTLAKTLVVEGIENLENPKYGQLVYDKLSNILYIYLDDLIELINVAPEGTGYVKRSGDTMTGRLTINVPYGPPLYVNSNDLVKNLNANYLQGNPADSFTRRLNNEIITGKWTFLAPTKFESSIRVGRDIVTNGSVGTSEFASGFGGYGWRMDADTNTLTVDNLVVRKLMHVYELVVNRISATNGSLWVTNAGKVTKAWKLTMYTLDKLLTGAVNDELRQILDGTVLYFGVLPANALRVAYSGDSVMNASGAIQQGVTHYTTALLLSSFVVLLRNLDDLKSITLEEGSYVYEFHMGFNINQDTSAYNTYKLFSPDFKFDTVHPIVPRNKYSNFIWSERQRQKYLKDKADNPSNTNKGDYIPSSLNGWGKDDFLEPNDVIVYTDPYLKYFASGDFYVVQFDDDLLPVFKVGDLLRCLKWTYGGIKYYDAVVCNFIDTSTYVLLLAGSSFDTNTKITYDDNLEPTEQIFEDSENTTLYNQTASSTSTTYNKLGLVEEKDGLVLMGNLWDPQRLNAVYITSVDDGAPYMDVMSGINRPDYSVIYLVPDYKTITLKASGYKNVPGKTNHDIPYSGEYYVLNSSTKALYALGDYTYNGETLKLFFDLSKTSNLNGVSNIQYLSQLPNLNTLFADVDNYPNITLEDDSTFLTEDGDRFVREQTEYGLRVKSTHTVKARFGKLDGIRDEVFPMDKQPYGYGLYASNVFLKGEFYLNNGRSLAEISNDAIIFAMAAKDASDSQREILRRDTELVTNRIKKNLAALKDDLHSNYYNKDTLKSAGIMIVENQLALWGGSIYMYTKYSELDGYSMPTALFENGKIVGKFLSVDEAHANDQCKYNDFDFVSFTNNDIVYSSAGVVRTFRNPTIIGTANDGSNIYGPIDDVVYVRKFTLSTGGYRYLIVEPNGYPKKIDGEYQVRFPSYDHYDASGAKTTYSQGDLSAVEDSFLEWAEQLKVWALEKNGIGNVGGHSLYWDNNGHVTVDGTLYSKAGEIGGFTILDHYLSTDKITIGNMGYDFFGYTSNKILPYISLEYLKDNSALYKTLMTAKGVFYLKNNLALQSSALLFLLTIIPIHLSGGHEDDHPKDVFLFARLNSSGWLFEYAYVLYEKGHYYIHFPHLGRVGDSLTPENYVPAEYAGQSEWFIKEFIKGTILFLISSFGSGEALTLYSHKLRFNNGSMILEVQNSKFKMGDNINHFKYLTASVDQMAFNIAGHSFNSSSLSITPNSNQAYAVIGCLLDDDLTGQVNIDSGVNRTDIGTGWYSNTVTLTNLISISTFDNDPSWGGFSLTCTYNSPIDSRYIKEISDNSGDSDEINSLRNSIYSEYMGLGGKIYSLSMHLNSKVNNMSPEEESSLSGLVTDIRANLTTMGNIGNGLSNLHGASELYDAESQLDSLYSTTSPMIEALVATGNNSGGGSGGDTPTPSGITILSSEPSATSVDSVMRGLHTNADPLPSSSGTHVQLGYIETVGSNYGTPTVYGIYISEVGNMVSNVTIETSSTSGRSYDIYGDISVNSIASQKKIHLWIQFANVNELGYINVYLVAGSASSGDSNSGGTASANSDMDTYLNSFKTNVLTTESSNLSTGTKAYDFLSYAFDAMKTLASNLTYSNIASGPVVDLASEYSDTYMVLARNGWFLALLLTSMFPYRGSISSSNINNDILAHAMTTWGINSSSNSDTDNYNVNTYTSKYKGLLMGAMCFCALFGNSTFLGKYRTIKNVAYNTSAYTRLYSYLAEDDGDYTAGDTLGQTHTIKGLNFFPYPPSNSNSNSGLMGRDNTAYTNGKALRNSSTIAGPDISHGTVYLINIFNAASGKSYSTSHNFLSGIHWSGRKTVNQIKGTTNYARLRPGNYKAETYSGNKATVTDSACTVTLSTSGLDSDTFINCYNNTPTTAGQTGTGNGSTSYPSGHSGYGWGTAFGFAMLGGLSNTLLENLYRRAYEYSESRVIVGAHWQYDVEMGRIACSCMMAMLAANDRVISDLCTIRGI